MAPKMTEDASSAPIEPRESSHEQPSDSGVRSSASFDDAMNSDFKRRGMLPYLIDNNSEYHDTNIYVAMTGRSNDKWVYLDFDTNELKEMSVDLNTVPGPPGDPTGFLYAAIFSRLSDIPSNTIGIPRISSGKMFISFEKPLFLHFHPNAAVAGFTQPDFNNPADPNRGIRFETIELTWAPNGLWINTSRVDAYQYPMGLEVYGQNIGASRGVYKKVGELMSHRQIINLWPNRISTTFHPCRVHLGQDGIIEQPSKIQAFKEGGVSEDYFKAYIDLIWDTYRLRPLKASFGDIGVWEGRVLGDTFTMSPVAQCPHNAAPGSIRGIPSTQEVIEAKGKLAEGGEWDKNVQKMFSPAIQRHAIDVTVPSSQIQDLGDSSKYYVESPHNEYAAFFHGLDISHNSETYAFSFDDVFEQSSTIQASDPDRIRITIGGFFNIAQ